MFVSSFGGPWGYCRGLNNCQYYLGGFFVIIIVIMLIIKAPILLRWGPLLGSRDCTHGRDSGMRHELLGSPVTP